ncbi:MAG: hypothetical protein H6613_19650 [Ignavibacteriales bacterium]|nr:hypothetical protein [Ignavibacteriales bacterium]
MKEGFYNWYSPDGSSIFTYSPENYGWPLLVYKYLEEDAITAMHKLHKVLKTGMSTIVNEICLLIMQL